MKGPIILFFLLLSTQLYSREADRGFFRQIWLEDGLSQSTVNTITSDKQGFLWIGTQDGLNRYDGAQIQQYNFQPFNTNSLSGDNIYDLKNDAVGNIWIVSGGGLDLMNPVSGMIRHISEQTSFFEKGKKYIPYRIWAIDGELYCYGPAGFDKIVHRGDTYTRENITRVGKNIPVVYSVISTSKGVVAGTNLGLYGLTGSRSLEPLLTTVPVHNLLLRSKDLYFSGRNNIYRYNLNSNKLDSFRTGLRDIDITSMFVDNRGFLWVGTANDGVFVYSRDRFVLINNFRDNVENSDSGEPRRSGGPFNLKCNVITAIYQTPGEQEDIVWIGTRDAGVFSYSFSRNSFSLHSASLQEKNLNFFGMAKDHTGTIYASTNTGIYVIPSGGSASFLLLDTKHDPMFKSVESVFCDKIGVVWFGQGNDLYRMDHLRPKLVQKGITGNPRAQVMRIVEKDDSTLVIGTAQGFTFYDRKHDKIVVPVLPKPQEEYGIKAVASLLADSQGNLWAGSTTGLYFFGKNGTISNLRYEPANRESILSDVIMDIVETSTKEILVATTKGLSVLRPSAKGYRIRNYYKPPGLLNNFIYSVLPDKSGKYWMSTNLGICCFDPIKGTFRTYRGSDGIYINEFNSGGAWTSEDGELLFGGIGGLVGVYPEKLEASRIPPRIYLQGIRVNQKQLRTASQSHLQLTHDKNNLQLNFSVVDFSNGNTEVYYKLNKQSWMLVPGRQLTLANLAPGDYKLQVKAVNADGLETVQPLNLDLEIRPPFWQAGWFYLLVIAVLVGVIILLYRHRLQIKIRQIRERERIREEENEKIRTNAALDLHDEFGNGLTRISMLVEMVRVKLNGNNKDTEKLLSVISDNSTRLYNGTKDFIWSINSGNDNLYEAMVRIKDFADDLFFERRIDFKVVGLSEGLRSIKLPAASGRNITMIFKEALSNIVKHSKATHVELVFEGQAGKAVLRLGDDGVGFDPELHNGGFGLGNMLQRAGKVNAGFEVVSKPGNGSEVILIMDQLNTVQS